MINSIFNPYARGIVRVAPIKESIDTANLTPQNINIGSYTVDSTVTSTTVGKYYIYEEQYDRYIQVVLPEQYTSGETYYTCDISNSNLLEPIQDILDICGTNPTSIKYGKNTSSSEESGRTQGSADDGIYLNMHKDILGRVRNFTLDFPPMFKEKYSKLDNLFMNKTETITVTEGEETISTTKYIIWYYLEVLLPEEGGIIKDIVYVGDSSFNDTEVRYRTVGDIDFNLTAKPFIMGTSVNLVGKCAINGINNI